MYDVGTSVHPGNTVTLLEVTTPLTRVLSLYISLFLHTWNKVNSFTESQVRCLRLTEIYKIALMGNKLE